VNVLGRHGKMKILVTWKHGTKSFLWKMCTTSTECKTIMIDMLTVKSDMDAHMINQDTRWFGNGLSWCD
jgi:hypothetical protein